MDKFVASGYLVPFRRILIGDMPEQWADVINHDRGLQLSGNPDDIVWSLSKNQLFSTKSMYRWLERNISGPNNKLIWEAPIPLKIIFFMWQLFQNDVLETI